jgi:hypothetical protein
VVRGAKGREAGREVGHDDLQQTDVTDDISDLVQSEVDQRRGLVGLEVGAGGVGHDDLAAMADIADPCGFVDGDADGAAVDQLDVADVHRHADAPRRLWPALGSQGPLRRHRSAEGVGGSGKDRRDAVALGADLHATFVGDGLAQQGEVAGQGAGEAVPEVAQVGGRCLDVGHEQRPVRCPA